MKDKIQKLLQGNKEDAIIACSLIASTPDPLKLLGEMIDESTDKHSTRHYGAQYKGIAVPGRMALSIENKRYEYHDETSFYYKIHDSLYLAWIPGSRLVECERNYSQFVEVINHEYG